MTTSKKQTVEPKVSKTNETLPPPSQPKVPQHVICMDLAKQGYKAKQVSEITGISYNNVAWYFSKYGLTKIANEKLAELYPQVANTVQPIEKPNQPKTTKAESKEKPKVTNKKK